MGRGDRGLVTLEWLLIVAAVAALGASTSLIVQRVLDDTSEVPGDPAVRLVDADIAAAFIAAEANEAVLSPTYSDAVFEQRCETGVKSAFDDVVTSALWATPSTTVLPPDPPYLLRPARCDVTPRPDLGS